MFQGNKILFSQMLFTLTLKTYFAGINTQTEKLFYQNVIAYNQFTVHTLIKTTPSKIFYVHFYIAYVDIKGKQEFKKLSKALSY